ncbi:MAG: o-succinylbenzoate--CoA ligase [Candidatus Marinimicrobia bacterium]|nr:o-succinylbenzoate--CoA ligase [Candidatus Neomarinimicrobiota bacterium]
MNPSITHPLLNAAKNFSHHTALITDRLSLSYSELLERAQLVLGNLVKRGLKSGDIIVLDQNSQDAMLVILWACSLGNYIAFPVNTRFPKTALLKIFSEIQPTLIISQRQLVSELSISYEALIGSNADPITVEIAGYDATAGASLLMTSGSSGSSKIVQHSHHNHWSSALGSNRNIALKPGDKWLLTLPLYHVGGLSILYRTAQAGAAIVVSTAASTTLKSISNKEITHISLVAVQLQRILDEPGAARILRQMQAILLGGSALPKTLIQNALDLGLPILVTYGSTEMASQITTTSPDDRSAALTNSGKLLTGRDLIISHKGEILVKGPTLAMGYRGGKGLIDLRDTDGWFHTTDVGYLDVQGALTVTGRIDSQFISGGENIQPEHIELVLTNIPGITQALVLAQKDSEFGFRPVAYLQIDKAAPNLENIVERLKRTLPAYMIPVAYFLIPEELLDGSLKLSRLALSKHILDRNKPLHSLS